VEVKLGLRRTKKGSKIQAPENLSFMSVKITDNQKWQIILDTIKNSLLNDLTFCLVNGETA
jgi:hypothetical protein